MDTMQEFLTKRPTLKQIFVLIDGSIPPQILDIEFIQVLEDEKIPFQVIITKTDKCTQSDLHKHLTGFKQLLAQYVRTNPQIFQSSSAKGRGRREILEYIESQI